MSEIYKLLIFSLVSVVYLFLIAKLMGKKQIAQLEFIDYVMAISIGSISAEMATDVGETPFYYYLIGMTVFFLFDIMVSFIGRKGPALKHFFKGRPETIIYNGQIQFDALKKSKLDVNDIMSMCREKGYFDLQDIAYAVFETSGQLSVLPKGNLRPVVIKDISPTCAPAKLPFYVIIDGRISFSSLRTLGKDKSWLFEKTKLDKKTIKNVSFAEYDKDTNSINVQFKS